MKTIPRRRIFQGTLPQFRARYCSVSNSTNITTTTAVVQSLPADTEQEDLDGMHSTVSNTSRITCVYPGIYLFTSHIAFAGNATGQRLHYFIRNQAGGGGGGSLLQFGGLSLNGWVAGVGPGDQRMSVAGMCRMLVGDYMETWVRQNSGGNLNVTLLRFTATWIGP